MTQPRPAASTVRIAWAAFAGAWGAWLGFRGHYGSMGLVVVVAGAAVALVVGISVEGLLRRFGAGFVAAAAVASLVDVLVLWQLTGLVEQRYPGLDPAIAETPRPRAPAEARPGTDDRSYLRPCAQTPPADARERTIWDSNCR